MIEVKNLTKKYGEFCAVDGISFTVERGEILGFLGPNGAGKTTTMKMITGFMPPTEGDIKVAGFDLEENPLEVKKRTGYLPENPPLYYDMKVASYLKFVAQLNNVPLNKIDGAVDSVISKCALGSVAGKLIANLSKGFKQRVGLAQALVHDPEVIILDEPTIGLDPAQIIEIRQLIRELSKEHTVILSTHILPEVTITCNRIIIINNGKLVASDTYENLSSDLQKTVRTTLKLKNWSEEIPSKLRQIKGVLSVEKGGSNTEHKLIIETEKNDQILDQLSFITVSNQWGLLEMSPKTVTLEDVYLKLIAH